MPSKEKNRTIVHRYKNHCTWRGKRWAYNADGCGLLTSAIVEAGYDGVRIIDHRRRRAVFLTPREQL